MQYIAILAMLFCLSWVAMPDALAATSVDTSPAPAVAADPAPQEAESGAPEQATYPGVRNRRLESGGKGEPSSSLWYPQFGNATVDAALRDFVEKVAADYENEVRDGIEPNGEKPESWDQWEQSGFFTLSRPSADVVSITFNIYNYSGGAHGQIFIVVFNFNLATGQRLTLADLFAEPEKALTIMSEISAASLRKTLGDDVDEEMLTDGTEPTEANFQCLSLVPEGVVVEFQPYQVGPWSIGQQHVEIPLQALAPAKPNLSIWAARK